jgi:hypothetical protein
MPYREFFPRAKDDGRGGNARRGAAQKGGCQRPSGNDLSAPGVGLLETSATPRANRRAPSSGRERDIAPIFKHFAHSTCYLPLRARAVEARPG